MGAVVFLALASTVFPFLPSPVAVGQATVKLVGRQDVYGHFALTIYEALSGYAIAAVLGVLTGVAVGASRTLTDMLNPIILALYSVPKIIFLPLLMIIFGVGLPPKIANAALHAFFPIVLNALVGMREVERVHLKVARSMSATRWQILRHVFLPSMVLPVFAGLRLGLGLAFMGALLAELFESKAGIGYLVHQFYNQALIAEMLAIIIVVFCLILLLNAGMKKIENSLTRWRRSWTR
jgi:NitT/TauT family transport system permease protein